MSYITSIFLNKYIIYFIFILKIKVKKYFITHAFSVTLQKKSELSKGQISPKHPKSVDKSVVCRFINEFFESIDNY